MKEFLAELSMKVGQEI